MNNKTINYIIIVINTQNNILMIYSNKYNFLLIDD